MNPDQPVQSDGDYGYDEAHDTGEQERVGHHRAPDPDPAHPERTPRAADPGGDYGYDESHGF